MGHICLKEPHHHHIPPESDSFKTIKPNFGLTIQALISLSRESVCRRKLHPVIGGTLSECTIYQSIYLYWTLVKLPFLY